MEKEFYINQIDDIFAELFLDAKSALNIEMKIDQSSGFILAKKIVSSEKDLENGIDFELSTTECCGLNDVDLSDYLSKTVHTSSAYEYFDFVFSFSDRVNADIEFTDDCWKIRINSCF